MLVAFAPAVAQAGVLSSTGLPGNHITFQALPGEGNHLTVTRLGDGAGGIGDEVLVTETTPMTVFGPFCQEITPLAAVCDLIASVIVDLGDRNDTLDSIAGVEVQGGPGDDRITATRGTHANDYSYIDGGPGDDFLEAMGQIQGGTGADTVISRGGDVDCGPDFDVLLRASFRTATGCETEFGLPG